MKRVSLELGGHAPFIVFPDADPEVGAKIAVIGKFRNNGQVCIAPSRFYVHKDVREEVHRGGRRVRQGPEARQRPGRRRRDRPDVREEGDGAARIELVEDARKNGAKVLTGGKRSDRFDKGYFFEPTVLTEPAGRTPRCMTEEPFAPVMPLLDFSKLDDVIAAANNTRYGLAAYVFTNDLTIAWRMAEGLEAGIIGINDPVPATPQCPFGGMKESGLGRELGHEGLEAYLETKYVSFKLRDA